MNHLILLLWAGLMGFFLYLSWQVIKTNKKARLAPSNRNRGWQEMRQVFSQERKNQTNSRVSRSAYNNPFLAGLWHQLLIKCKFDVPTAERLILYLQQKHPGQTDRWYIEKAIRDIERDNRY
jgi:hypothetical protein